MDFGWGGVWRQGTKNRSLVLCVLKGSLGDNDASRGASLQDDSGWSYRDGMHFPQGWSVGPTASNRSHIWQKSKEDTQKSITFELGNKVRAIYLLFPSSLPLFLPLFPPSSLLSSPLSFSCFSPSLPPSLLPFLSIGLWKLLQKKRDSYRELLGLPDTTSQKNLRMDLCPIEPSDEMAVLIM